MTPTEEQFCLFQEMGLATTQWAHVEGELCRVVLCCFKEADREAVSLGFFSIENFRSKCGFSDKIICNYLSDDALLSRWKKLLERIRDASALRNALAHRSLNVHLHGKAGRRCLLVPWTYEKPTRKTRTPMPPPGSFGVRDVAGFRLQFFAISISLKNFSFALRGQPEPFPEPSEQAMASPTIHGLTRQIREVLSTLPAPSPQKH